MKKEVWQPTLTRKHTFAERKLFFKVQKEFIKIHTEMEKQGKPIEYSFIELKPQPLI